MNVNETCKQIRTALRKRSGKAWSVARGRGTGCGWITIDAPPLRCKFDFEGVACEDAHLMSVADRNELDKLLDLGGPAHAQGHSIPASSQYYREYVDRAEGRTPTVYGKPYWD